MSAHGWRIGILRDRGDGNLPAASAAGPVVLKVGGSLLSRPDWPTLLLPLMAACGPGACCLVVGGGAVVDGLRLLDRAVPQSPQLMHELAIDTMRLTAQLVAARVNVPLAAAPLATAGVAVLDVPAWLAVGSRATTLPVGWHVTSDAIAARVAVEHGGSLLLAKSVPPPPCPDNGDPLASLARAGWVDEHFPVAAGPLATIEWAAPDRETDLSCRQRFGAAHAPHGCFPVP
jgi:hypothetical protein